MLIAENCNTSSKHLFETTYQNFVQIGQEINWFFDDIALKFSSTKYKNSCYHSRRALNLLSVTFHFVFVQFITYEYRNARKIVPPYRKNVGKG